MVHEIDETVYTLREGTLKSYQIVRERGGVFMESLQSSDVK
jgi:hypothetical protein